MLVGRAEPRLWTPPLRDLTPDTSRGFEAITFAHDVLGIDLMPWQQWLLVHALELKPDGTYRFRVIVVLVSRQNGKTTLLAVLSLWRLLLDGARLVLGTSTNLDVAKESWEQAVTFAELSTEARDEFVWPPRRANGEQTLTTVEGARYKIAAATRRGGRGLSVDLGIADELREHQNWDAWGALSGTTTARPDPQLWALSNQGDDTSVVLNHFRDTLVASIAAGDTEGDAALFEWSAPDDSDVHDRAGWAQANPALGHTITEQTIEGKLVLPAGVFRTEHLCQRVQSLDTPIDLAAFDGCGDSSLPVLDAAARRQQLAVCLDVAPDLDHVALVAAVVEDDGRVRGEVVAAWDSTEAARGELGGLLSELRPRAFGWYPNGPAAALAADLAGLAGIVAEPLKGEVPAICQGLAELVKSRRLVHSDDPLLQAQVRSTSKLYSGDGWRFARRGAGHVNAVYALAGAVHLARTLPAPAPRPRVRVGRARAAA